MNSPLFGGLFDLDNNGRMDSMERGAEIGFIYDVIDDEETLQTVFEMFKKKYEGEINFE